MLKSTEKNAKAPLIQPIKIFYCYASEDAQLQEQLEKHLSPLRQMRHITGWSNRNIQAGEEWKRESEAQLDAADIILLLISADFISSEYQYTVGMKRALDRHREETAYVIPIILRPVTWEETPLGALSPLPTNRNPVTLWNNQDAAFADIVQGIKEIIRKMLPKQCLSSKEVDILYHDKGPLSGKKIGEKYLLGKLLGEGGYSHVYKAEHLQLRRPQALKILQERHFQKSAFRERFLREAQTVAALDHPNIIHLDDFGVEPAQSYLVMPFISGGTLQDIFLKQTQLPSLEQITKYLEHICAALDYAHAKGIAHLDLKPHNLLVRDDGGLLLADFGLAHLMKQGTVEGGSSLLIGSHHYMAPEHIQGHPEPRSDLFSLGVILYQMLVGRLPFEGVTPELAIVLNVTTWPLSPRTLRAELSVEMEKVVGKALAKQPEYRYQTAGQLMSAFKRALQAPVQPQSPSFSGEPLQSAGLLSPQWPDKIRNEPIIPDPEDISRTTGNSLIHRPRQIFVDADSQPSSLPKEPFQSTGAGLLSITDLFPQSDKAENKPISPGTKPWYQQSILSLDSRQPSPRLIGGIKIVQVPIAPGQYLMGLLSLSEGGPVLEDVAIPMKIIGELPADIEIPPLLRAEHLQQKLHGCQRLIDDWMQFMEEKWRTINDSQLRWRPLRGRWSGWDEIFNDVYTAADKTFDAVTQATRNTHSRRFETSKDKGSAASAVVCFLRDLMVLREFVHLYMAEESHREGNT